MGVVDLNDLHNPTPGAMPTAAWGDQVRDNFEWVARDAPVARVYRNVNQAITTNIHTAIAFNGERWDNAGMHSNSTNNSRLTIPAGGGGLYTIHASALMAANGTGVRELHLRVNGTTTIKFAEDPGSTYGFGNVLEVADEWNMFEGDYIEALVFHSAGADLNVLAMPSYSPEFSARWVRANL